MSELVNNVLDSLGDNIDESVYEMYCELNMHKFSKFNLERFEDVYFSLFQDSLVDLQKHENDIILDIEIYEDYDERMELLYSEIFLKSLDNYSYVRFLAEIDRNNWENIISDYIKLKASSKTDRIISIYKDLKND